MHYSRHGACSIGPWNPRVDMTICGEGRTIAAMLPDDNHRRLEANQRLLATAPELLEIVQGFVLNEKQLDDEHFKHLRDRLFAAAREVWLEAKGEST